MNERFNQAAADWDQKDTRQQIAQAVFETITSRVSLQRHMEILDFGCGTGLLSFKIAPLVRSVTGVDLSEGMLGQLKGKNTSALQVTPLCRDILEEPLEQRFDGIISSMAIHHVEQVGPLFKAFRKALKRDGFLAISDLEAEDGSFHTHGNDGVHHFGFEREELRRLLEETGFFHVRFHHAHTILKGEREYSVFLVTAATA